MSFRCGRTLITAILTAAVAHAAAVDADWRGGPTVLCREAGGRSHTEARRHRETGVAFGHKGYKGRKGDFEMGFHPMPRTPVNHP